MLLGLRIPELAELIRGARFYIGNDSGPMHLAAAVGTPTLRSGAHRTLGAGGPGAWTTVSSRIHLSAIRVRAIVAWSPTRRCASSP